MDIIDILENEGALIDALEIRLNIPDTILNLFVVPRELYFYPFEDNNVEKYLKVAKSEMDISLGIISQCTNDISILNFKLILAHYFACLKDSKQAKVLFDEFNSAGVSLNHCAFWLKKIHEKLSLKFTKMPDI